MSNPKKAIQVTLTNKAKILEDLRIDDLDYLDDCVGFWVVADFGSEMSPSYGVLKPELFNEVYVKTGEVLKNGYIAVRES